MNTNALEIIAALGVPGLALYVLYLLFNKRPNMARIPRGWAGPLALTFMLIVGTVVVVALRTFGPNQPQPNAPVGSDPVARPELTNRITDKLDLRYNHHLGTFSDNPTGDLMKRAIALAVFESVMLLDGRLLELEAALEKFRSRRSENLLPDSFPPSKSELLKLVRKRRDWISLELIPKYEKILGIGRGVTDHARSKPTPFKMDVFVSYPEEIWMAGNDEYRSRFGDPPKVTVGANNIDDYRLEAMHLGQVLDGY